MVNGIALQVPFLGCLARFISMLVGFVVFVAVIAVHLLAIVKGVNGQRLVLPFVSQYAIDSELCGMRSYTPPTNGRTR